MNMAKVEVQVEKTPRFGDAIKVNRQSLGWSQKLLGQKVGLSREFVCMLELGKRFPSFLTLQKIARAFDKDVGEFLIEAEQANERLELALLLREIAESEDAEGLRELVAFAQELSSKHIGSTPKD